MSQTATPLGVHSEVGRLRTVLCAGPAWPTAG